MRYFCTVDILTPVDWMLFNTPRFFPVYFAALILSLSQQMASDRINLYPTGNETLW